MVMASSSSRQVIDLTDSPPPDVQNLGDQDGKSRKRKQQQQDDESRKKIMSFAQSVAAAAPPPGTNSLLAQLHAERLARQASTQQATSSAQPTQGPQPDGFSVLSYNVWFSEQEMHTRMAAIGQVIANEAQYPTFICLQETTPENLQLLQAQPFWQRYEAHRPPPGKAYFTMLLYLKQQHGGVFQCRHGAQEVDFDNSVMGRGLRTVNGHIGTSPLLIATSHFESPVPKESFAGQREQQAAQTLNVLDASKRANVLFAGDTNWGTENPKPPPLLPGWHDAWESTHNVKTDPGYTYDGVSNAMLTNRLRGRLDRVWFKCADFDIADARLVGTSPVPGATYTKMLRSKPVQLPVLPSDHYGLLCKFVRRV